MFRSSAVVLLVLALAGCGPVNGPVNDHPATEFTSSVPTQLQHSSATCHARHVDATDPQAWLPDPSCTPGKANPAVTLGMLCPIAHTKQWRPPASYTSALKRAQLAKYDYVDGQGNHPQTASSTEEDHLISLELGGDPRDPNNLWPEPHASPNEKDQVETAAHAALCRGALTLPQVQQGLATDWYGFSKRLGVKLPSSAQLGTDSK